MICRERTFVLPPCPGRISSNELAPMFGGVIGTLVSWPKPFLKNRRQLPCLHPPNSRTRYSIDLTDNLQRSFQSPRIHQYRQSFTKRIDSATHLKQLLCRVTWAYGFTRKHY
ncbi:uncharacterized protein BDZ83DRAFT_598622, partial [Colletotrichum acutatum]